MPHGTCSRPARASVSRQSKAGRLVAPPSPVVTRFHLSSLSTMRRMRIEWRSQGGHAGEAHGMALVAWHAARAPIHAASRQSGKGLNLPRRFSGVLRLQGRGSASPAARSVADDCARGSIRPWPQRIWRRAGIGICTTHWLYHASRKPARVAGRYVLGHAARVRWRPATRSTLRRWPAACKPTRRDQTEGAGFLKALIATAPVLAAVILDLAGYTIRPCGS